MTALVELRDVAKFFGARRALRDVDLAIGKGEIVGFVGPNGAGKSTCLRICVGLVSRDRGHVAVLGLDPAHAAVAIRERCAYLPGETSIYHRMTGQQLLDFALFGYARDESVVALAPELFDLPLGTKIRGYSAGMKQRLALRAVLSAKVDLLLLDEPDRALDATARMQLRDVLRALRDRGRSVFLSSHHLAEVEAIADRTVFLLDGACVPEATVRAARDRQRTEVRLWLAREVTLPDGGATVRRAPDGSLHVRTQGDPFAWLARIPPDAIAAAEVGATRLEDLYRELTGANAGGAA